MKNDIDIYGVFVPALALWMLVAFVATTALKAALERLGFYRFVWRRPLFDLSLYVVVLAATAFLSLRLSA